jgi:Uma2 family endonuclease
MATVREGSVPRGEERVVLRNVRWETYESLLADQRDAAGPRLAYDGGTLEIMSPLIRHEETNRNLQMVAETLATEWDWDIRNVGSATFRLEAQARGFEPDSAFYVQNAGAVGVMEEVSIAGGDPPPDLVIEVDFTSSSLPKLPLLHGLGVPEIWRYFGTSVRVLQRTEEGYAEAPESAAFPGVTPVLLNDFLARSGTLRRAAWVRSLQDWARANRPTRPQTG